MARRKQSPAAARQRMLLDVARELAAIGNADGILVYLLDTLTDYFQADRGFAVLTNESGALEVRFAHNVSASRPEDAISHTITSDVANKRTPVLIRDASADPILRERTSVMGQGIRSVMCAPMIARGELVGLIYVDNLSKGESFTGADLNVLTLLSGYAGAALYNARLVAGGTAAVSMREEREKLTALSQMAAGLAHDFKNVLWAMQTRLELMKLRSERPDLDRDIEIALEAVDLGRAIVAGMSQFAEVGYAGPAAPVDMADVVGKTMELLVPGSERGKYKLELDLPQGIVVRMPESHVRQIVMNLVTNALDAMPNGGTLSVSLGRMGCQCVLRVRDTGVGIPDEVKARIFEPCFTTKGERSMGLGLSLVHALVIHRGGTIAVESTVGEGSTFRVYLPCAGAEKAG